LGRVSLRGALGDRFVPVLGNAHWYKSVGQTIASEFH